MLKKTASLLFAAALSLAPVQTAAAWDQLCMKFPLWKTAYVGHFTVVHGRDFNRAMPSHVPDRDVAQIKIPAPDHTVTRGSRPVWDAVHSGKFAANQSRCVDLSAIPNGRHFAVYVITGWSSGIAHCATHESNPNLYYTQQDGKFQFNQIWFEGWGSSPQPRCKFSHTR